MLRMGDVSVTFSYITHQQAFRGTQKITDKYPWYDDGGYNCTVYACRMNHNSWRVNLDNMNSFSDTYQLTTKVKNLSSKRSNLYLMICISERTFILA